MERNKHIFCLMLSCLLSLGSIAAQELQVAFEEERTFSISLTGEQSIMGLQIELFLPDGMTLVDDTPVELGSTLAGHTLRLHDFGNGHYLLLTYNLELEAATIDSEELLRCHFQLSPDVLPDEYPLTISGIKLAKDAFQSVCPMPYEDWLWIDESGATGIEGIKNEELRMKNDGEWYDLSGRKIVNRKSSNGKLPRGINIIEGKKILR